VTAADPSGVCGDLLAVISLLSPEGVPRDLLYGGESEGAPGPGAAEIDESLARLADASLLTFSGDDGPEPIVTAHRLVMRVTRERHAHDGTLTAVGTKACDLVATAFRLLGEPWQHRAAARDLVRQVIALNDHLTPHIGPGDRALAENLLSRRGWAWWCLNDLADNAAQAVDLGEPLVADIERVLGESHPDTLTSRNNLAAAYRAAGRVGDAGPSGRDLGLRPLLLAARFLAGTMIVGSWGHPATRTAHDDGLGPKPRRAMGGQTTTLPFRNSLENLIRGLGRERAADGSDHADRGGAGGGCG
jgi:hypothetical protein